MLVASERSILYQDEIRKDLVLFLMSIGPCHNALFSLQYPTDMIKKKPQTKDDMLLNKIRQVAKVLRPFVKPFLLVFAIYCIAMISLWRANVSYIDDGTRAIAGYAWNQDFSRYSSSILSYILNVNFSLSDISPWPQIVAMAILSVVSLIVTYILCDHKIKYLPLLMSTFIGLTPFMMGGMIYKFDAPCVALAMLAAVLPFLLWDKINLKISIKRMTWYGIAILLSLIVMWTSRQAANGIFIVMILAMLLKSWLDRKELKRSLLLSLFFGVLFILSACLFQFGLPATNNYRSTSTFGLPDLGSGIIVNLSNLFVTIFSSFNIVQLILLSLLATSFIAALITFSKRKGWHRILDAEIGIIFVMVSFPLSIGVYIILKGSPMNTRSLIGVGFVLAIAAILMTRPLKNISAKMLAIPGLILLYSFVVFFLAFGNALADQERWAEFRANTLAGDLSRLYPNGLDGRIAYAYGDIGQSVVMQHVANQYPVINIMESGPQIQHGLSGGFTFEFGMMKLTYYDNFPLSGGGLMAIWRPECSKVVLDTYYHKILEGGNDDINVCISIKPTAKFSR